MQLESGGNGVSTLRDYLGVLRLRKWILILAVLLLPSAAVLFSLRQERLYEASADVLVTRKDLAATLSGIPGVYEDPARFIQTQVELARVPSIARLTLDATGLPERSEVSFLRRSSVQSGSGSDLLTFRVTDRDPRLATELANEYARQFTIYRRRLDTSAVRRAREEVEMRIGQIGQPPPPSSPLHDTYANLIERREQLRTMEALQAENAALVRRASGAGQVQPRPLRNGILGLGLGLVFGIGLAFLWHALDTRVRSAEEIRDRLGLGLLGRLPEPPRKIRRRSQIAMLVEPHGYVAESLRVLRTNLEFANLDNAARSIMVTSPVEGEGKSTTVANLGVAFARAGRRVVVVDLDLRRPTLDRFFQLDGNPGVTDVALGHVSLEEALVSVAISSPELEGADENGRRAAKVDAVLELLPSGAIPPDPGEFVGTATLAAVIARLEERADLVLIDAPPLLHVGDAMVLSSRVDAILLVTRLNMIHRRALDELRRLLDAAPAAKLGFVLAGVEPADRYAAETYYHRRQQPKRERVS